MKVRIPTRNTREPIFHHGPGGNTERVYPGNRKFSAGDKIERPPQGAGEPGKNGSPDGESMDEFVFEISRREFLDLLFEDMALPNLTRKQLVDNEEFKFTRAGFAQTGPPSNINVVRSMRSALARRVALGANKRRALRELIAEREDLLARDPVDTESVAELDDKIQQLRERINRVPFIDEIDLRYHQHVKQPQPRSKAVMFCVMDVSGSMDQSDKDLAKRFFIKIPFAARIAPIDDLLDQLQGAGYHSAARFARVEKFLFVDFFCRRMVADKDDFSFFVMAVQKEI